ncbi:unnamed protein product [Protopolystoma xenopodis]|uniref:Uncharacterized protein n=1 Tax=Protopolystoma xenopodis TaxID=117903 RepID=A0A3S5CIH8_9PLAT|nr:unnamed protein product [Protopolystoma xenopodis]
MLVCFIKRSRTEAAATSAANAYAETRHITDTKIIIGSPTFQSATISSDAASQTTATMRWSSLSGLLIVSLSGLILQKAVNILQLILKHVGQPATLSVSVLPRDKEIPVNLQMPPISEPADEPALGETVMRTLKLTIPSFMGSPYHSPTRSPDTSLQVGLLELMSPCFQLLEAAVQTTCLLLIPHCHSNKRQNYEYQPHRQRNKIRSSCVKAHSFACQSIPTSDNLSFQIPQSSNRSSKPTAPLLLSKRVSALSPISHTTLRGHLLIVMVSINCALWVLLVLATLQLDCSPWGPPLSLTPRPTSTPHPTQIQSKTIPTDWPLESSNYAEFSQEAHHVKRFESKIWIGLARLGFAASSIFRFTSVSILIRDLGGVHAE